MNYVMEHPISRPIRRGLRTLLEHRSFKFLGELYAGQGSCLMYHRVTTGARRLPAFHPFAGLVVDTERFEEQVRFLSDNYRCLDLPSAVRLLSEGRLPKKSVVVTFDDGYRDNLTNALPILEKYKVPATIYVATGLVDRTCPMWWYEIEFVVQQLEELTLPGAGMHWKLQTLEQRYAAINQLNMLFKRLRPGEQASLLQELRGKAEQRFSYDDDVLTWDEVVLLDRHPLITVGAHTKTHAVLSRLSEEELYGELRDSKRILEERLNHPIEHFAYPYGQIGEAGEREFFAAREVGFASGFTTRWGHLHRQHHRHLQALPRIAIGYYDSIANFAWKLSGMVSMIHNGGRRIITL